MPLFEFKCKDCDKRFEKLMSFSKATSETIICPFCNGDSTERCITKAAVKTDSHSSSCGDSCSCSSGGCGCGGGSCSCGE